MARRVHVRARLVDLAVDGEGGAVDGQLGAALEHAPALVDEHEVRHADLAKVPRQRVDPEPSRVLRVAQRDVAGDPLVEALAREDAEGGGEVPLVVGAGGGGRGEGRRGADGDLAGGVAEEVHVLEVFLLGGGGRAAG